MVKQQTPGMIISFLIDYVGDSGTTLMGIPTQSTVWQALSLNDWQVLLEDLEMVKFVRSLKF